MSKLLSIPRNDPTWWRLPDSVRRDALRWEALFNAIHTAKNRMAVMRSAIGTLGKGSTLKNMRKRYYKAVRDGWVVCVNWSKVPNKSVLPALFIEHWIKLTETFKRGNPCKRAHDRLREQYRRWQAGDPTAAIPGYTDGGVPVCPKPRSSTGLPKGWEYTNLMRLRKAYQSRAEAIVAQQGLAAARAHLPHVPQDVSDIRPLEYVVFDDVEIDFLVTIRGCTTPVKLRLLVAMDLCSRVILGFGVRPAITRPDGVEDSLKLRDMKCIVARVLARWGYPLDYTMTLIVERATATLKEGDIAALNEISSGQVRVSLTSMITGAIFEFADRASGNSWGKAWLESFFNWLHNELGDREGQKGRRYDLAPAELHGRSKELALLMRAGNRLPLALRHQLRLPFMHAEEALQELNAAFAKANARTDHQLQGFDEVQVWRLPLENTASPASDWQPVQALPALAERLSLDLSQLTQAVEWGTPRMESPNERFGRKIVEVDRQEMSACSLHRLMDEHKIVKFSDWQFSFEYQGKEYIYLPPERMLPQLEHEKSYLAWFDPTDLSVIYLTRDFPHRGWIGELKLFRRTRRGEIAEKKETLRETKHALNRAAGLVAGRNPEKFDTALARAEQNIEVLRNVNAAEVEIDVVSPGSELSTLNSQPSSTSPAVRAMTDRILARAHASDEAKQQARRDRGRVTSADAFLGGTTTVSSSPAQDFTSMSAEASREGGENEVPAVSSDEDFKETNPIASASDFL